MVHSLLRFDMRSPDFSPARTGDLYLAALEMASWADERGFDSVIVSEHHATEDGFLPAPIPMLGALVGRTRRMRVGAAALLLPFYDPVKLAEDLVVLELASGGRVFVTVGIGYRPEEFAMFGCDFDSRGKRMDECLEVLLRAWSGEDFEWQGRRVCVRPRPASERPPVLVGGMGRIGARRAARFGLPFQPGVRNEEVIQHYLEECERLGVANPLVLPPGPGRMVWVSEDPDRTWSEIGPYLLHDAVTYASWQPARQRSTVHSDATSTEELRAEGVYRVLTPEECVELARADGGIALFPLCGGTPPDLAWPSLELYAGRVLPRLREGD